MRRIFFTLLSIVFLIIYWGALSSQHHVLAQESASEKELDLAALAKTIEESIKVEKNNLEMYRDQLDRLTREDILLAAAVNGYQLQLSTYGNLLLASGVDIMSMQKAWTEIQASETEIQKMIDGLKPRLEAITAEKSNIAQQRELIKKQIVELREITVRKPDALPLWKKAQELSNILTQKDKTLEKLKKTIAAPLNDLTRVLDSFSTLSTKFESSLDQRKKQYMFERRKNLAVDEALPLLEEEIKRIIEETVALFQYKTWTERLNGLWKSAGFSLVSLSIVFGAAIILLIRLRRIIVNVEERPIIDRLGPWHALALKLIYRSFFLTGLTLLIYIYSKLDILHLSIPALRLAAYMFMIALAAKWAKLLVVLWPEDYSLPPSMMIKIKKLTKSVRNFCWFYLLVFWILGDASLLLLVAGLLFEIHLIGWAFLFWRKAPPDLFQTSAGNTRHRSIILIKTLKTLCYSIGGVALVLTMFGYFPLALHWLLSWGRSIIVICAWTVLFFMLQEWDRYFREKSTLEKNELLHDEYPLQWLMIRIGQAVWLISLVIVVIFAWDGRQTVLAHIYSGLAHPLNIGAMSFSGLGVIYAIATLLITQAVSRIWRWFFQTKFLNRSGMEVGLQDSLTTITVYVIWALGILIALHVFGLNTASLAVAFGALGIGLGFGLQAIFNNFISGIILLFERPIQVGDDVEVNGVWATVKKINVRSTVVQTYDNASLIIPNSDFISNQVTNWSFKDKRIRRSIVVGVAYGSDINLVRELLLDIARNFPKVLKRPEPDVLFTDFGDSALIFKVRFWTDLDNMLKVETGIRFEIDRLFREHRIEIAFPQRDIHIRSIVETGKGDDKEDDRKAEEISKPAEH